MDEKSRALSGDMAHSIAAPIVVFLYPILTCQLDNQWIHITHLLLALPIAAISLHTHKRIHGRIPLWGCGVMGLILFLEGAFYNKVLPYEVPGLELAFTATGSVCLIVAHLFNMWNIISDRRVPH